MEKQILSLTDLNANDIVKVVRESGKVYYCIVKSCTKVELEDKPVWMSEEKMREVIEKEARCLKMVEFNEGASEWNMTIPLETNHFFTSFNDKGWMFALYKTCLEKIKTLVGEEENKKTREIFVRAIKDVEKVQETYSGLIARTMEKLLN